MSATVATLINKNAVVIFSWVHCPFCSKAKQLLTPLVKDLKVYEIDTIDGGEAMKREIESTYKHDTVPAIFIHGKFVGGCSDVEALHKKGSLVAMINGA